MWTSAPPDTRASSSVVNERDPLNVACSLTTFSPLGLMRCPDHPLPPSSALQDSYSCRRDRDHGGRCAAIHLRVQMDFFRHSSKWRRLVVQAMSRRVCWLVKPLN